MRDDVAPGKPAPPERRPEDRPHGVAHRRRCGSAAWARAVFFSAIGDNIPATLAPRSGIASGAPSWTIRPSRQARSTPPPCSPGTTATPATLPWRVPPADRAAGVRPDPYRVWLSEVMLQQTTIGAVRELLPPLPRRSGRPSPISPPPRSMPSSSNGPASATTPAPATSTPAPSPSSSAAAFPATYAELLTLPGIGAYTAAAVAAICFDERVAVIDGNVDRLLARYLALAVPVREAKDLTPRDRPGRRPRAGRGFRPGADGPRRHHLRPAPGPLHGLPAPARAASAPAPAIRSHFPVKAEKPERPTRYGHAFVIRDAAGDIYLRQRPPTGPPRQDDRSPDRRLERFKDRPGLSHSPPTGRHRGQVVHVFTHFRLELEVWTATDRRHSIACRRLVGRPARRSASEALPSLFRKVLTLALGLLANTKNRRPFWTGGMVAAWSLGGPPQAESCPSARASRRGE